MTPSPVWKLDYAGNAVARSGGGQCVMRAPRSLSVRAYRVSRRPRGDGRMMKRAERLGSGDVVVTAKRAESWVWGKAGEGERRGSRDLCGQESVVGEQKTVARWRLQVPQGPPSVLCGYKHKVLGTRARIHCRRFAAVGWQLALSAAPSSTMGLAFLCCYLRTTLECHQASAEQRVTALYQRTREADDDVGDSQDKSLLGWERATGYCPRPSTIGQWRMGIEVIRTLLLRSQGSGSTPYL